MSLHEITLRRFYWSDLEAIVEVMNRVAAAHDDEDRWTLDEIRHMFEMPDFNPEIDSVVAVNALSQVVGVDSVEKEVLSGRGWAEGFVDPHYARQQVGRRMVQRTDAHLLRTMERHLTDDKPIYIYRHADERYVGSHRLFEDAGYRLVRYFYRMMMLIDEPIAAPPLPGDIELRTFDPERETYAVYEAQQEAFRDHWGHGGVDEPFETWQHILESPKFDPSLWLIAYDGGEIAGVCLNRPFGDDQPDMGFIGALGVRQRWRKRGLGTALLLHSFRVFQERGFRRVSLGVDAESQSNAVALYERVGMTVHKRRLVWRKILRGSEADIIE